MWGHYAHSHSGFVIEFDKHHDFFNQKRSDKDEYGFLREIIYQDELPNLNPLGGSPVNYFFVKSNDWKYEKEWRMLLPEYNSVEKKVFSGKVFDLFFLPSGAIKNVILGCRVEPSLEEEITSILTSRADYNHVNIIKAVRSNDRFEILL